MMTEFILTPTNLDFFNAIFRNPISGKWTIPVLTFNTRFINPYYGEVDLLNEDSAYQRSVIDHFYMRLTEKWLYKDSAFKSLLKYFKVEKDGDEGKVSLIDDPDHVINTASNMEYQKYIFRYIEKYFITKRFISKILKQYVNTTHIKWYDLFNNIDNIKELFVHKLKKLIISTIYEVQDQQNKSSEKEKEKTSNKTSGKTSNKTYHKST
jgi:hypothetical protein